MINRSSTVINRSSTVINRYSTVINRYSAVINSSSDLAALAVIYRSSAVITALVQ